MLSRNVMGEPYPWTNDFILQQYRFCNVFREDDKTTIWFRNRIRNVLYDDPKVLLATIGFRWFNRIETGEKILHVLLDHGWNEELIRKALKNHTGQLVTGAYMIKTPAKMNKLDGICWCMERVAKPHFVLIANSLQEAHDRLCESPYLGGFMSYEIVTDLRHTKWLQYAPDIMTWAHAGPGARRGLEWLLGRTCPNKEEQLEHMIGILDLSRQNEFWPSVWPVWEMREVEHTLCEFDKYLRAKINNQRLKRRFVYGDQSTQRT